MIIEHNDIILLWLRMKLRDFEFNDNICSRDFKLDINNGNFYIKISLQK